MTSISTFRSLRLALGITTALAAAACSNPPPAPAPQPQAPAPVEPQGTADDGSAAGSGQAGGGMVAANVDTDEPGLDDLELSGSAIIEEPAVVEPVKPAPPPAPSKVASKPTPNRSGTSSGGSGSGTSKPRTSTPSKSRTAAVAPSKSTPKVVEAPMPVAGTADDKARTTDDDSYQATDGIAAADLGYTVRFDQYEAYDEAAPGVERFSQSDWHNLTEDRVMSVANEPGPGTDPGCYAHDMLPLASKGKLTKAQVECVTTSFSKAEYDADQARLSLVLIANAQARGETDNWSWLVARHLESVDEENPGLAYRYAMFLYSKGPDEYRQSLRWANVAMGQRAAWSGETYHERVTRLLKLRAAVSQALWQRAEDSWKQDPSEANRTQILEMRDQTRVMALEWYRYAKESGLDSATALKLCTIASIDEGCDGAEMPPS